MSCLICNGPAETFTPQGDYEERRCIACGHYRVAGTVVAQLEDGSRHFDVPLMQQVLQLERASIPIPMISSYIARLT
jgi:hypothetical protein